MGDSNSARRARAAPWHLGARLLVVAALGSAGACSTVYYGTLERFGIEKRDLLVDRVEEARESQQEAKEQFDDALERFRAVVGSPEGDLEAAYDEIDHEYEESLRRAEAVRTRIDAVEEVAEDLFREWEAELEKYASDDLRARSAAQLRRTRSEYAELRAAMRRAEESMEPVLEAFQDRVLFLKHNLNAQAIASLEAELGELRGRTRSLVSEMEAAIAEADRFIRTMRS